MEYCIFCYKGFDSIVMYQDKPICDDCLEDLLNWATLGMASKKLNEIEKKMNQLLKQMWHPVSLNQYIQDDRKKS